MGTADCTSIKIPNTSECNFEDDVEMFMDMIGWRTIYNDTEGLPHADNNAKAQADYDRKLALKVDSLIDFVRETQPEEWAKSKRCTVHTQKSIS